MGDIEHVGAAEAVPGVHHAVLAERDRNAERPHFRNARQSAPPRIGVVAALQRELMSGLAIAEMPDSAISGRSFET